MKKTLSILLIVVLLFSLFTVMPLSTTALSSGNYNYKVLDDGTAAITRYTGSASKLTIPSSLNGYAVTCIYDDAFMGCSSLTSIVIPDSVTNIEQYAFYSCTSLTSVTIPNTVTYIGLNAFEGTAWFDNQPDGLVYAGKVAYKMKGECPSSVTIKNGTLGIADEAFWDCGNLTSVSIPDSVKIIGWSAFELSGLLSVNIPNSVTSIGPFAFCACRKLTTVSIPKSVIDIDRKAFSNCDSLTTITVDSKNNQYRSIDGNLYDKTATTLIQYSIGKPSKSFTIPNSVTNIGDSAFSGCTNLTSIIIPTSVKIIDDNAFEYCDGLTSVVIPDSVTNLGSWAFFACTGLTNVIIGDSVENIESWTFRDCNNLVTARLGQSVVNVGEYAFIDCNSLFDITIPRSVQSIGGSAFYGCDNIFNVFYSGSESDWGKISIEDYNDGLSEANIHYNYANYSSRYGWCLANIEDSFGYDDNYRISAEKYYSVFGINFSSLFVSGVKQLPIDINTPLGRITTKWQGNCFGLALLSLADYHGKVNLKNYFGKSGNSLYNYGYECIVTNESGEQSFSVSGNQGAIDLIERAMVSQDAVEFSKCEVFKNDKDYSQLLNYLSSDAAQPLLLAIGESHALVLTTDFKPIKVDDSDWYILPAYDSNSPYNNGQLLNPHYFYSRMDTYIMVNTKTSEWRYLLNGESRLSGKKSFGNSIRYYDVSKLDGSFFTKNLSLWHKHIQLQFGGNNICIKDNNNNTLLDIKDGVINRIDDNCECKTKINADNSSTNWYTFYTDKEVLFIESDNQEIIGVNSDYAMKSVAVNDNNTVFDFSKGIVSANNDDIYSVAIQDLNNDKTISVEDNPTTDSHVSIAFDSNNNGIITTDKHDISFDVEGLNKDDVEIESLEHILGDVDADGTVTIVDATFIQRHLASIPIPFVLNETIADADEDGIISIMDATYIQRWLAQLKSNNNIGKPIT